MFVNLNNNLIIVAILIYISKYTHNLKTQHDRRKHFCEMDFCGQGYEIAGEYIAESRMFLRIDVEIYSGHPLKTYGYKREYA
jgi:hypothetical protein